jgi:hypothetical protein
MDVFECAGRAAVLPLVPMGLIEDLWFKALNDLEDIDIPANTTTFTDYLTTQWIEGDRKVWNHFNTDGSRTTNHIEVWRNKLKKKVAHRSFSALNQRSSIKPIGTSGRTAALLTSCRMSSLFL